MVIEIIVGDEVVEIEEGPDNLRMYVHQHFEANLQEKAWAQRKAIAAAAIERLQESRKEAYQLDFGIVTASKRDGISRIEVDKERIADAEFTREEVAILLQAATGFNREAVDPGLKASDPAKWAPTTPLGRLFASCLRKGKPGNSFVVTAIGTKYA
jgi:hypothetical protein